MTSLGTKQLEDEIYAEIRARIKEDDISAPIRRGPYYYYRRTLQGKEYVQHCRRLAPNHEASLSVHDTMPTGPDAPPEHVILDENVKAQGEEFYSISAFKVRTCCFNPLLLGFLLYFLGSIPLSSSQFPFLR